MPDKEFSWIFEEFAEVTANPLLYIESWRAKHPGQQVVGFFPTYVPTELILAVGALPVGLWGGSVAVSGANAFIQQFTCSIVRSTTQHVLNGTLDGLDAVLFPPICDTAKLVSSSWCLNFSERFLVDMVVLPERLDSAFSVTYLAAELRRVAGVLSRRFDRPVADGALHAAIATCGRVRDLQRSFYRWRQTAAGTRLGLQEVCTIVKAGTIMDPADYIPLMQRLVDLGASETAATPRGVPVVVTGLACQLPHGRLLSLFEASGLRVVGDDLLLGMRACGEVTAEGDPYLRIARGFVDSAPLATRHHCRKHRHELVVDQIQRGQAKGVVCLVPKFCEPEWFDLRYLQQEFERRAIPNIVIDFEEAPNIPGAVQTRLEAFAEALA